LIGFLGIVAGIAALVFFFGGYYSIAATEEDPKIVAWALTAVRNMSISHHATEAPPASFNDPATVQAGARAFATRGCVECHGAPGANWAKFSEGLRPDPPDLKDSAKDLEPREVFWVVKNGINMTGMPSFARAGVDDKEIWTIVAFVKKLPVVSDADFKNWTAPPPIVPPTPPPAAPAAPAAPQQ